MRNSTKVHKSSYVYQTIKDVHSPLSAALVFSYGGWSNGFSRDSQGSRIFHTHARPLHHRSLLLDEETECEGEKEPKGEANE